MDQGVSKVCRQRIRGLWGALAMHDQFPDSRMTPGKSSPTQGSGRFGSEILMRAPRFRKTSVRAILAQKLGSLRDLMTRSCDRVFLST